MDKGQIAVMNICYQFYSFDYFLDSTEKMGVTKLDIWAGYPHLALEKGCEAQAKRMGRMVRDRGMEVVCLTPKQIGLPLNIADERPKYRARAVDYLKLAIDLSGELGTDMVQIVPGTGLYNQDPQRAWDRSAQSIAQLADYASQAGKTLVLEPLQLIESNLLGTAADAKRMLDQVGSPALKAVIDTCHMEKQRQTLNHCFGLLGASIAHIHLNEQDQLPWGEGNSDIDTYLAQLAAWGYEGYATLEVCSRPHYIYADWAMNKNVSYVFQHLCGKGGGKPDGLPA